MSETARQCRDRVADRLVEIHAELGLIRKKAGHEQDTQVAALDLETTSLLCALAENDSEQRALSAPDSRATRADTLLNSGGNAHTISADGSHRREQGPLLTIGKNICCEATMGRDYGSEKLLTAIDILVTHPGKIRERLADAFTSHLFRLNLDEDFPPAILAEYKEMLVTAFGADTDVAKAFNPETALAAISDKEASKMAQALWTLYHRMLTDYSEEMK